MKKLSYYLIGLFAFLILSMTTSGQKTALSISVSASGQKIVKDTAKPKTDINLSDEVVKKLTNQEIVDLIKYKEELANKNDITTLKEFNKLKKDDPPVPILIVIFGSFVLMIFIPYYFSMRKTKSQHMMMNNLIEKGHDIPKELIFPARKRTVRSDFHKGIILLSFGVSLCLVLFLTKVECNYWTIGFIPILVGVGYMISHKYSNPGISKTEGK